MGPIVVGLGLHRRMKPRELESISRFSPIQHDPDDCVATAVVNGIPGSVYRPVAEAPYAIAVGVVELHQYAGLSGGHKAVAVGCGGRETIAALHHRDMVTAPGVCIGALAGNPFRTVVNQLGHAAGCRLALVYVPAAECWLFGDPEGVLAEAMRRIQPWEMISNRAPGAVLDVPDSKASSLYQASRAATYLALSPQPPVVMGGTLILRAACSEGLGSEAGFVAAMKRTKPPWTEVLRGPPPRGPGAQRVVMLAKMAERYRLRVEGCSNPEALKAVGIDATSTVSEPPPTWLRVPHPFQRLPQCSDPLSTD
jgi:nickel-dependent lactate racemase